MLLALSVAAMLISALAFADEATYATGWVLHLAAVLLFVTALVPLAPLSAGRPFDTPLSRILPILAVVTLAAGARLWVFRELPFGTWYDEASNGLAAARILADPTYRPLHVEATQ